MRNGRFWMIFALLLMGLAMAYPSFSQDRPKTFAFLCLDNSCFAVKSEAASP